MAYVIFSFLLLLCYSPLLSAASPPPYITPPPPPTPTQSMHTYKPPPPPFRYPPPSWPPPQQLPSITPTVHPPQQPLTTAAPPPQREMPQERMKNILEALIGSGDFANWGNLLTTADPTLLPFTSTLFVPNNDAVFSNIPDNNAVPSIYPFLFLYHVVPHRLSFADLCLFTNPNTRLPTLLPTKSILITNALSVNFSIDGVRVTDPDLYLTDSVSVHGIGGLLDYQNYGGDGVIESFPWMNQNGAARPPMTGVGVPNMVERSKGGILQGGFVTVVTLSVGLFRIGEMQYR